MYSNSKGSLKFFPRLNLYKASNLVYDPVKQEAWSYEWYCLYKVINGVKCFNNYSYSATTVNQQTKLKRLLRILENNSILYLEAPQGLQNLDAAIRLYESRIEKLRELMNKKGTRKSKNEERFHLIINYQETIIKIKELQE